MKIQCDVCDKKEAQVFCCADEAALCHGCDQRVHHANKLASKHHRFSLFQPTPSLAPLCDICREKRALIFCQEDRAILCRDCELPLHTANEHTQKHNRFLLTGIKLSGICDSVASGWDPVPDFDSSTKPTSQISNSEPILTHSNNTFSVTDQLVSGGSSSNVRDNLIDMLPQWHFEDFEDASFGFKKGNMNHEFEVDEEVLSFWDVDIDKKMSFSCSNSSSLQSENLGFWVPQAPAAAAVKTPVLPNNKQPSVVHNPSLLINGGIKQQELTSDHASKVMNRNLRKDDVFTVPQITLSFGSKRPRNFW